MAFRLPPPLPLFAKPLLPLSRLQRDRTHAPDTSERVKSTKETHLEGRGDGWKKWRVRAFFFFGHETPTRSHTFASLSPPPFPAFSLFSTLPSFLQQTNQASEFFVSFFECRAVHRVGMMES